MPVRYILSSVWVSLNAFSHLFVIQYIGLSVFRLPISLVMVERIHALSYYHHQIGSVNYYPLFRVKSWNNGVRCKSLYIRMTIFTDTKIMTCRVTVVFYLLRFPGEIIQMNYVYQLNFSLSFMIHVYHTCFYEYTCLYQISHSQTKWIHQTDTYIFSQPVVRND